MTVPRWPLWVIAAVAVGPTPACQFTSSKGVPITPPGWTPPAAEPPAVPPPKMDVVDLPRRPGERAAKPTAVTAADPPVKGVPAVPAARPADHTGFEVTPPLPPPDGGKLTPVAGAGEPGLVPLGPPAPLPTDPPAVASLRAFLDNRPADGVDALKGLGKGSQELALVLVPALARGVQMDLERADPQDVAILAEQLHAAAARLEPRAALRVEKATFCRRVTGFGRYDPWPAEQPFRPNDLAELYVEIRNVPCEPAAAANGGGESFVTRLASTLEVRDGTGRAVDQTDPADWRNKVSATTFERTDVSRSPVRDYFLKYRFPVPAVPGPYVVTVEVRDPSGRRSARCKPVAFQVSPP